MSQVPGELERGIKRCECGEPFSVTGKPNKRYCSKQCRRRADHKRNGHSARQRAKRARVETERIKPEVVFNEAVWHCQICGRHAPKKLMGSNEPNAPTLDHIVPISKGGSHIRSNVQLACLECNQAKGNGEASQQNYHGLEKHYTEEVQPKTLWQKFITWAKAVKGAE